MEEIIESKNTKRPITIIAIITIIIIGYILTRDGTSSFDLAEQLSLGEQFLQELDYEQALLVFNKILEIDPKNVEAYLGAASAYVGLDDLVSAIAILEKGYELTEDSRIEEKLRQVKNLYSTRLWRDPVVIPLNNKYTSYEPVGENLFKAQNENGLWGLVDRDGNPITEFIYSDFGEFSEGFIIFDTGDSFINVEVSSIIREYIKNKIERTLTSGQVLDGDFSVLGSAGYMNTEGEIMFRGYVVDELALATEDVLGYRLGISPFHSGLAYVGVNYSYSTVSSNSGNNGSVITYVSSGSLDSIYFCINDDFEILFEVNPMLASRAGRYAYKIEYVEKITFAEDGLIYMEKGIDENGIMESGFANREGEIIVPCTYEAVMSYSEGMAGVYTVGSGYDRLDSSIESGNAYYEGKWGFVDTSGTLVIPCMYDSVGSYSDGLAYVLQDGKWGFIDQSGNAITEMKYDSVWQFSEGMSRVKIGDKLALLNEYGEEVTPFVYDGFSGFYNGLALVLLDGKIGVLDKSGNEIIPLLYDNMSINVLDDLFIAGIGEDTIKYGMINSEGEEVLPFEYDSLLYKENTPDTLIASKDGEYFILQPNE